MSLKQSKASNSSSVLHPPKKLILRGLLTLKIIIHTKGTILIHFSKELYNPVDNFTLKLFRKELMRINNVIINKQLHCANLQEQ